MPQYDRKDSFYKKAKKEGYPARSAYKLIELDKKFGILKPNHKIIDLGCAPGGWLKVIEERLFSSKQKIHESRATSHEPQVTNHNVVGIDLLPLKYTPEPSIAYLQGDFLTIENQNKVLKLLSGPADWILSDMSPNISGIAFKDAAASVELCEAAFHFAKKILKKNGGLVLKVFPGQELEIFRKELKQSFNRLVSFIPDSSRKTSIEIYLVCTGFKGNDLST